MWFLFLGTTLMMKSQLQIILENDREISALEYAIMNALDSKVVSSLKKKRLWRHKGNFYGHDKEVLSYKYIHIYNLYVLHVHTHIY